MSEYNEVDNVQHPTKDFDEIIKEVENNLNCIGKDKPCHMHYEELQQFHRGHFYRQWWHRFRRLGSVGVIAIPNTTLEDMIYWLYEFMRAYQEDYNEFKKLVCQALNLHEEHLRIIDGVLKDHEDRIKEIERQLVEIWKKIEELTREIANIKQEITNIKNDITNINGRLDGLEQTVNSFKANIFNVSFSHSLAGSLSNNWRKGSEHDAGFGVLWDWNNAQDHSQGIHYQFLLNYLYNDNATNGTISNGVEIGKVPVPQEWLNEGYRPRTDWIYSGYIVQGSGLATQLFINCVPIDGNQISIRAMNFVRAGEVNVNGKIQINVGGVPTSYLLK